MYIFLCFFILTTSLFCQLDTLNTSKGIIVKHIYNKQSVPVSKVFNNTYTYVDSLNKLPKTIKLFFGYNTDLNQWDIAEVKHQFQQGCIVRKKLPQRRFISAYKHDNTFILFSERGGKQLLEEYVILNTDSVPTQLFLVSEEHQNDVPISYVSDQIKTK